MYSCVVCGLVLTTICFLSDHLKFEHRAESSGQFSLIKCGQRGCARAFRNLAHLRRHLETECIYPAAVEAMETEGSPSETEPASDDLTTTDDFITYNSENFEQSAEECLFDLYDKSATTSNNSKPESQCNNVEAGTQCNKSRIECNDMLDIDFSSLEDSALKFIGSFYANPDLSRVIVQTIIESTSALISKSVSIVQNEVNKMLEKKAVSTEVHSSLSKALAVISEPFSSLDTEFKRFSCLLKRGVFLKPESFVCGRQGTNKLTGQFISLKQIFRRFFELPNVLSSVLSYIEIFENERKNGIISNFIQGELWKSKARNFVGKIVLPFFLHFDDVELGNCLGSHNNIHKLGAMNAKCPCIPPEFVSLLENHFLVLLFHSTDRKADNALLEASNNKIMFNRVIEEINDMRSNGIKVETEKGEFQLCFDIGLILGDNLGLHSIFGLAESFVANFPCLYCKMSKAECGAACKENVEMLRNCDNYEEDLATENVSLTGLKERCVFNEIDGFHMTTNFAVDFMHDVLEGVCSYDLVEILFYFVYVKKYFSLQLLNSLIFSRSYGNVSNKPPLISEDDLKSGTLRMSANEMLVFVQHLPVLIGEFVPNDDKFWRLFLFLYDIVLFLMCGKLQLESVDYFRYLVTQHHLLYVELLGTTLKPKHHHLLHYFRIVLLAGPPIHFSSMRFESQHRLLKRYSNVCFSRVDIAFSVALKQALSFAYRLLCKKGFHERLDPSHRSVVYKKSDILNLYPFAPLRFHCKCTSPNSIKINGIKYAPGTCLITSLKDMGLPVFGLVHKILVNKHNCVCFIMSQLLTTCYNEHLRTYSVVPSNDLFCLEFTKLPWHMPVFHHVISVDTFCVSLYHLI